MAYIEVKNLSFKYDGEKDFAINKLSFTAEEGEFITVLGHNGSGKSTFARLLNGLLTPTEGEVIVDGLSTKDKDSLFEIRKRVGVVFQNPDNQLVASIVEDDMAFGPENIGLPREEIAERIDFALGAVDMLEYKKSTPTRLSGGQKQRIAIAGMLAIKPKVLVLDESTSMLDPKGREEVMKVVKKLNKENGMAVIHITHYMDETIDSDKIVVLKRGEIVLEGKPETVFMREDVLVSAGLSLPNATLIAKNLGGLSGAGVILSKEELAEKLIENLKK